MKLNFYTVMLCGSLVPIALYFLVIGLRGLVTRMPFVISEWWERLAWLFSMLFGLIYFSSLLPPFRLTTDGSGMHVEVDWWGLVAMILLIFLIFTIFVPRFRRQQYIAIGVTDESFWEALLAGLEKLDVPYEETFAGIRFPGLEADLQVNAVTAWDGLGLLTVKRQFSGLLDTLAQSMNEYYRTSAGTSINLRACSVHVAAGVFMLLMAGAFMFCSL